MAAERSSAAGRSAQGGHAARRWGHRPMHPAGAFQDAYAHAFHSYLDDPSERGLAVAYEIGRSAVADDLGMLELTVVHHQVLAAALAAPGSAGGGPIIDAAADFLLQALSAFEMVHRGFREAQQAAVAEKRLAEQERRIAETLQRALLPAGLPPLNGITAAARYLPGAAGVEVGGDWFDAVSLPGGRTGIAVGDVVGRGIRAASVMGQMRTAFRAYALEGDAPRMVLTRLNQLVPALDPEHFSTMIYLHWDPDTRVARMVSAGHPPPLLVEPGSLARYVEVTASLPLGVMEDAEYHQTDCVLAPGSTLLLYTDGLIEERGLDHGLARLQHTVTEDAGGLESLCDHVLDCMLPSDTKDDAALLALRFA